MCPHPLPGSATGAISLHWLWVPKRIQFKIAVETVVQTYRLLNDTAQSYLPGPAIVLHSRRWRCIRSTETQISFLHVSTDVVLLQSANRHFQSPVAVPTDGTRGGSSPKILGGGGHCLHQPLHQRVHFLRSPKPKNTNLVGLPTV